MAKKTDHLEWHGQQWRVKVAVPRKLQEHVGKKAIKHPLGTSDLDEADRIKGEHVSRIKQHFKEISVALAKGDDVTLAALDLRASYTPAPQLNSPSIMTHSVATRDEWLNHEWTDEEAAQAEAQEVAERVAQTHGLERAREFYQLATHQVAPLDSYLSEFNAFKRYPTKSYGEIKRAIEWLTEWMRSQHIPLDIRAVTQGVAARFIREKLELGRSRKTCKKYLGFLREYWAWLRRSEFADINPWLDQEIKRDDEPRQKPRAFTDAEISTLLTNPAKVYLPDLMRIAALSGMRIEEICRLKVSHCQNDIFEVKLERRGKSDNVQRTIPIHSALKLIVERRMSGKKPDEYLIHELPIVPVSRDQRADPASKRFTRYRRSVGVDDKPNAGDRSLVNFHSFRRWFMRKEREARLSGAQGFDVWTLIAVVGHSDIDRPTSLDLSQRGYAGEDGMTAKRLLVESVKLPKETKGDY